MPINADTLVRRIDLSKIDDVRKEIKIQCDAQAARSKARRLAAAFEAHNQLILVFQRTTDDR